jgi:protoporphyrinogen oxidase
MQALPDQLAARLGPERLRYDAPVAALLKSGDRTTGVVLASGETLVADEVVLASSYPEIQRLAGLTRSYDGNAAITLYFGSDQSLTDSRMLFLDGRGAGLVNQVLQMSNVSRAYAPEGKHLIAAQVLGDDPRDDEALASAVKAELATWFPQADLGRWELLEAVRTPFALFREEPAVMANLPKPAIAPGLWMASELLVQSSIEGALSGGRLAARAVLGAPEARRQFVS